MNEKLVDYSIGFASALRDVAPKLKELLRREIKKNAANLAKRGDNLLAELDRRIAS